MVAAANDRPGTMAKSCEVAVNGWGFDLLSDDGTDDEDESLIGVFLHLGMARSHQDDEGRRCALAKAWANRSRLRGIKESRF